MNVFCIESILAGEKRRLHKADFCGSASIGWKFCVSAEQDLAFFLQLGQSFQARGLLRFVTTGPTFTSGFRDYPLSWRSSV